MLDFLKDLKEVILTAMAMVTAMVSLVIGGVIILLLFILTFLLFHPVGWLVVFLALVKLLFA